MFRPVVPLLEMYLTDNPQHEKDFMNKDVH